MAHFEKLEVTGTIQAHDQVHYLKLSIKFHIKSRQTNETNRTKRLLKQTYSNISTIQVKLTWMVIVVLNLLTGHLIQP